MAAAPTTPRRRRNRVTPVESTASPSSANASQSKHAKVHQLHDQHGFWKIGMVLGIGLAFHLVYMLSIFDIYFKSPLVHGVEPIVPTSPAPAKRLVLFVGDGCRADKAFEMKSDGKPRAPFLHEIALTKGTFGVSHTRVPTESRPGHIAMIAGFYEDVSAVTKGWKANPVDYDHLLARARYAWSFGAPEIVDLFSGPNVYAQHYSSEMIDFSLNDAKMLDKWSFDRLKEVIEAASIDKDLERRLKSDQVVIFVHLLGLDTNGHAHKPHSKEYLENIEYVDSRIKESVRLLDEFYQNDGQTAYIFTADHGMSDAGTHGDGNPDNTRTPFVGWGAGLSGPQEISLGFRSDHDSYSSSWQLDQIRRRDMNQADMTPLMATLIGIPIPVNSEGVLPIKHLGTDMAFKVNSLLDNARQLVSTFLKKEVLRKAKEPFYVEAPHFSALIAQKALSDIGNLIKEKDYIEAQRHCFDLINQCLSGLQYLQKYDSFLLKGICTSGYLGWILYAISFLISHFCGVKSGHESRSPLISSMFTLFSLAFGGLLMAKQSPLQFYVYLVFPVFFWHEVFQRGIIFRRIISFPMSHPLKTIGIISYIVGLEFLVSTFFERSALLLINLVITISAFRKFQIEKPLLSSLWIIVCLMMSAFPLLEPIKDRNETFFISGVVSCLLISLIGYLTLRTDSGLRPVQVIGRLFLIAAAGYISIDSDTLLKNKLGLPIWNQNVAWILLSFSFLAPILVNRKRIWSSTPIHSTPFGRLLDLFMTFAPAYIILSVSYEPLFYALFSLQIFIWTALESSRKTESTLPVIAFDHLWVAYGFLFFVNMAFFGTGNMASVSSFTLDSVYRLITVFSPFSMAALLILKLLIPFCLLSAACGVLSRLAGIPPVGLILLIVGTTDIMTLNFFFLVRDHGSWLEIGTSISHFVIASGLIVFTLVLFGLSHLFLAGVKYPASSKDKRIAEIDAPIIKSQ